jgi:tetratricopeptide (TPR) repeat protein
LSETANQLREVLAEKHSRSPAVARKKLASVRMSPGGYLAVAAIMTFAALVCLRTQRDLIALIMVSITWALVPLLIITDRLSFDGKNLKRTGLGALPRRIFGRGPSRVTLTDIERVEVTSLRTLRRGGNVRYRYRVEICGGDTALSFVSGGRQFRRMVQALLPCIPEYKLDARACELRDHLADPRAVRAEAARLQIAPASVLENAAESAEKKIEKHRRESLPLSSEEEIERATLLRRAANDLRIAGCLQQSAEAFRRGFLITPGNAWMIYEYARLLKSQASAFGDARLLGRACAALRLAASRGQDDPRLLERVGESFLEYCDPRRAAKTFRKVLEIDEDSYRAQLGLAEVALSEGKLAHVIHHYNEALRNAPDKSSARLARREADYYCRLNDDEDYLAAELRRMNWLEGADRIQRLTARVSFAALLIALVGSPLHQFVAGVGWALASSSIIAWCGSLVIRKFLAHRGRFEPSA